MADPSPDPLEVAAATRPDDAAVIVADVGGARPSVTTNAELDAAVNRLVHALAGVVRPGERLVWCGPNSLEVLTIIAAARKLHAVAVPLSYRFSSEEMTYVIENSDAVCVLVDAEYAPQLVDAPAACPNVREWVVFTATDDAPPAPPGFVSLAELVDGQPDAPATIEDVSDPGAAMIYTSGTTGKPKGAMRTGNDPALIGSLLTALDYLHPDGVHLTTGPLYHSGPLAFCTVSSGLGHTVVVMRRFDPSAWVRLVREHRVTSTFTAPTQLKRIVSLPDGELAGADCSSMVTLIANAAPVPYALKKEVIAKLGDGFLYEVYGSTELGVDCILPPEDQLRKPGSCGKPYPGVEIRIVGDDGEEAAVGDPGELFVRSVGVMDGYHRTSEQLTEDEGGGGGWRSVGDIAYVDEEGYVHICDRKKDMIISGGVNIYPAEIEAVLYDHPAVLDAAVFGVPDDEWGEAVHAVLQAKPDVDLDLDDVRAHVDEHLGRYKRPRTYELRDELPRTDSGKLLKRVLRDEHWKGRTERV